MKVPLSPDGKHVRTHLYFDQPQATKLGRVVRREDGINFPNSNDIFTEIFIFSSLQTTSIVDVLKQLTVDSLNVSRL